MVVGRSGGGGAGGGGNETHLLRPGKVSVAHLQEHLGQVSYTGAAQGRVLAVLQHYQALAHVAWVTHVCGTRGKCGMGDTRVWDTWQVWHG